jgi:hypothetical protein
VHSALAKRVWQARTLTAALVLPPLLSTVSFARLAGHLARATPAGPAPAPDDASLAWWVDSVLRRLPRPWTHSCLKRAVVLFYLLRRAGRTVSLCIGVRRDAAGTFAAHAWLVQDGAPYLEPASAQPATFELLASFPESRANAD